MSSSLEKYPKPGEQGGRLIRQVMSAVKTTIEPLGLKLPFTSHILIAVSGGPDSIALAHLLLKYGRRVAAPKKISLLHINHGWRPGHADEDEKFVRAFAKAWKVPLKVHRLKPPKADGQSWEEVARRERKRIFNQESEKRGGALVLTGHHADDLAETVLWRLMTGAAQTHAAGIYPRHGVEIRPLLGIRKNQLLDYLREEKQEWRQDESNFELRFLRARIRKEVMPVLEHVFPRAVEHLNRLASEAATQQQQNPLEREPAAPPAVLIDAAGLRLRRANWRTLKKDGRRWDLPGGWQLKREQDSAASERWVLERAEDKA